MIEPKVDSSVMSLKQAASYLQVSKAHLSNLINGKVTGVPPVRSFRLGRRVLFKREWIDAWIEAAAQDEAREC
jgi:excisionase family DNA binding protein